MPTEESAKTASLPSRNRRSIADHPSVGMWAGREDLKDVQAWRRKIGAPRYDRLGRRRPKP